MPGSSRGRVAEGAQIKDLWIDGDVKLREVCFMLFTILKKTGYMLIWVLFGLSSTAQAATYLVYFDVSSSVRKDHKSYIKEYVQFSGRFQPGDKVMLLKLDANTLQFNPFRSVVIDAPDARQSATNNKKKLESSIYNTYANIDRELAKPIDPPDETSILGAFVSASDYFNQEKVPANERVVVMFTDGIEESAQSGIWMRRQIPGSATSSKLKVPTNLQARVYMLGIDPKQLPPPRYAAQKAFWETVVKSSGSDLSAFRDKLGFQAESSIK